MSFITEEIQKHGIDSIHIYTCIYIIWVYLSLRIEFEVNSRNLYPNVAPVCVLGPFSHRWLSSVLCENRQITHLAPEHVIVECQAIWSCCKMFSNVYQSSIFINFLRKPIVIHSSIETEIYKIHLYDTSLSIDRNLQQTCS